MGTASSSVRGGRGTTDSIGSGAADVLSMALVDNKVVIQGETIETNFHGDREISGRTVRIHLSPGQQSFNVEGAVFQREAGGQSNYVIADHPDSRGWTRLYVPTRH